MEADIDRVLIPQRRIAARVIELAGEIMRARRNADQAAITIVPIMTGAMIFCGDLIRQMPLQMKINIVTVSSYPGAAMESHGSHLVGQQLDDISGRDVLLVDDILDSGGTLALMTPMLKKRGARRVQSCVLLRKNRATPPLAEADFVGFQIPDQFVVGYGLDYNDYYRNLPDIVSLKPEAIARWSAGDK